MMSTGWLFSQNKTIHMRLLKWFICSPKELLREITEDELDTYIDDDKVVVIINDTVYVSDNAKILVQKVPHLRKDA